MEYGCTQQGDDIKMTSNRDYSAVMTVTGKLDNSFDIIRIGEPLHFVSFSGLLRKIAKEIDVQEGLGGRIVSIQISTHDSVEIFNV